ncbi:MAG TPA: TonB-dependent receptor plug domain-containing protein, partial [Methylomirabilota bacterium]|nr:TonB-dependent receptor plug domain-containing protein [Methylomirabilota bacterium]
MRRVGWLVAAAALLGAVAEAQEVRRLDPVVVSATKLETPAEQVGAAVTVVTGEDIATFHYPTVEEALRSVPGVEIRRSGSLGKTSSISIRGANANQVQVLVNGVRVKSPTLGQAELADFSP